MPVQAANTPSRCIQQSLYPVYSSKAGNLPRFVFWDAIQYSNILPEFESLVFVRNLGVGATFVVDLCQDISDSEHRTFVARKTAILPPDFDVSAPGRLDLYSLLIETQMLQFEPLQSHPNIITLLGMGWTLGIQGIPVPRLIVEYAKHGTLSTFLQSTPNLGTEDRIKFCLDVALGLRVIHKCGLVHGDMKLENILVFEDDHGIVAKISDFGCSLGDFDLERTQHYRGTEKYYAPEISSNKALNALPLEDLQGCDIYAFGLCVWEVLTNGLPYFQQLDANRLGDSENSMPGISLLEEFDRSLGSLDYFDHPQIARRDSFHFGDSGPGERDLDNPIRARLRSMFRDLVHGCLHPIPSQRYNIEKVVNSLATWTLPHHTDQLQQPVLFRRATPGVLGFAIVNTIPFEAQQKAISETLELIPSLDSESRGRALVVLSDAHAHGCGAKVEFSWALRYLQEAAQDGYLYAEVILMRIWEAIHSEEGLYNNSQGASNAFKAVRPSLRALEHELAQHRSGNFSARMRGLCRLAAHEQEKVGFTIEETDHNRVTVAPGNAENLERALQSGILQFQDIGKALISIETSLGSIQSHLIYFVANNGWLSLLQKLVDGNKALIFQSSNLNLKGRQASNPGNLLLAAAVQGQTEVIRYLLGQGVSAGPENQPTNAASVINALSFLFMIEDGDQVEEIANLLVQHGADPNMNNKETRIVPTFSPLGEHFPIELYGPPLDLNVWVGDERAVRALLKLGADPLQIVNATPEKQAHSSLELAICLHLYSIVDAMLESVFARSLSTKEELQGLFVDLAGSPLCGKGMFQRWLLHGAEYREACSKTIEVLVKHDLSLNFAYQGQRTPVGQAAWENPCQNYVLEALLEAKADPNLADSLGKAPLIHSGRITWHPLDNEKTTRTLVQYGADVNKPDNDGNSPAHYHALGNSYVSLGVLLNAGADLEAKNCFGMTPLFGAAQSLYGVAGLKLLLDRGADIEASASYEMLPVTPLGWATSRGVSQAVIVLLDHGASIYQPKVSGTVLNLAASTSQVDVIRLLLQKYKHIFGTHEVMHYAGASTASVRPLTPLDLAIYSPACIDALLGAHVSIDYRDPGDEENHTTLAYAVQNGQTGIAVHLLYKGASPFCRGDPDDKTWSILNEYIYFFGKEGRKLPPKFPSFLRSLKSWIDKYSLLSVRNWAGLTITQFAVHYGQVEALKALVEFGASVRETVQGVRVDHWPTNHFFPHVEISGLDLLSYATFLRNLEDPVREGWWYDTQQEIQIEEMDRIIDYLEELQEEEESA